MFTPSPHPASGEDTKLKAAQEVSENLEVRIYHELQ